MSSDTRTSGARSDHGWIGFLSGLVIGGVLGAALGGTWRRRARSWRQEAAADFLTHTAGNARTGPMRAGLAGAETLFDPRLRSRVAVRDMTAALRGSSTRPPSDAEVAIFRKHRQHFAVDDAATLALRTRRIDPPPPGGLGAGVAFKPGQLLFQQATAAYYYLLAPREIGGTPQAELLYMTSSNRAARGCEALLSYFGSEQFRAVFRIWDWSTPKQANGSQFVLDLDYDALKEYLIPYELRIGSHTRTFNTVYVISSTERTSGDTWRNDVYLHNHARGVRDRVWTHTFEWPSQSTDDPYWWGPIFETFPETTNFGATNLLGYLDTLLVQDGMQYQLTDANSQVVIPTGNGLNVVYRSQGTNAALVCE